MVYSIAYAMLWNFLFDVDRKRSEKMVMASSRSCIFTITTLIFRLLLCNLKLILTLIGMSYTYQIKPFKIIYTLQSR